MPITPFLKDSNFSPDLTRVVKVAFEMTCTALKFPRNDNPVVTLAAKRIVELAKAGEHSRDGEWVQVGESAPVGWIHSTLLGSTPP